jgi:hypothetical protein
VSRLVVIWELRFISCSHMRKSCKFVISLNIQSSSEIWQINHFWSLSMWTHLLENFWIPWCVLKILLFMSTEALKCFASTVGHVMGNFSRCRGVPSVSSKALSLTESRLHMGEDHPWAGESIALFAKVRKLIFRMPIRVLCELLCIRGLLKRET